MHPTVWGSLSWYFLHKIFFSVISFSSWKEKKDAIMKVLLYYPYILPCHNCTMHTLSYYKKDNPQKYDSAEDMAKWSVRFHNETNVALGKKIYSFNEIKNIYQKVVDHKKLFQYIDIIVTQCKKCKPDSDMYINSKKFLQSLSDIFPCKICQENLSLMNQDPSLSPDVMWKNIAVPWIQSHLPQRGIPNSIFEIHSLVNEHDTIFKTIMKGNDLIVMIYNPLQNILAKASRIFPVCYDSTYMITIKGYSSNSSSTIKVKNITDKKYIDLRKENNISKEFVLPTSNQDTVIYFSNKSDYKLLKLEIGFGKELKELDRILVEKITIYKVLENGILC